MEKLLTSKNFSDFQFKIGNKKFNVHKNILSARSPVFEAMFKHGLKESNEKQTEITDVEVDVFEAMLKYIYTNKIPDLEDSATDLLMAANKVILPMMQFNKVYY